MLRLLLAAGLSLAAASPSPVMDALAAAAASLAPRFAEFRQGGPKPILGALLQHLHAAVGAAWAAAPAAARAAAVAAATSPVNEPGQTSPMPGPYWRWVPILQGYAAPAPAPPLAFAAPCFASTTAAGAFSADGATYTVTLTSSAPANASCADSYLLATVDYLHLATQSAANASGGRVTTVLDFPVSLGRKAAQLWTARNGALIGRFIDADPLAIAYEALETLGLFIPSLITSPLTPEMSASNYDFIARYANITMLPRPAASQSVALDPSLFQSGDIVFIHRGDGLATLEQWATGATTSHTTMFLRSEATGELFVVESQSNGADWAVDRIQKNPWPQWQQMAARASYGYVWLPMAPAARANFNVTKAWAYFNATEGVNYGFEDFAPTFYDTPFDNLPWPARPEELEVVIGILEGLLGFIESEQTPLINLLFTQTMVQRLGGPAALPFNASFLEALEAAAQRGLSFAQLLAMPEQDSYLYPAYTGSRAGGVEPALVCNAYACALHKAAGSFGALADSINCADTHNAVRARGGAGRGRRGARAHCASHSALLFLPPPFRRAGRVPDEHL
jgi:hypothetical protein